MSADTSGEEKDKQTLSDVSRREVLLTFGGLGAAIGAGAAMSGGLELNVSARQTVDTWTKAVCRFCGDRLRRDGGDEGWPRGRCSGRRACSQ